MAILTFDNLEAVPEDLREFAVEQNNKVVVNVTAHEKLKSFRENNISIAKELDFLKNAVTEYQTVTGVDLEELKDGGLKDFANALDKLRETKRLVDDGTLVKHTSVEEAASARVQEVSRGFKGRIDEANQKLAEAEKAAAAARAEADATRLENAVRIAAADPSVALVDGASDLVLPCAQEAFKIENGQITARDGSGTTLKEWLTAERAKSPFLFKGNGGGNASGGGKATGGEMARLNKLPPAQRIAEARRLGLA